MLSISEFKKLAGEEADNLTDEEIEKVRDVMCELSNMLFDMWIEDINKKTK